MIQPLVFKAGMYAQNNFPLHKHEITLNTAQFRQAQSKAPVTAALTTNHEEPRWQDFSSSRLGYIVLYGSTLS